MLTLALKLRDEIGENTIESDQNLINIPSPELDKIVNNYIYGGDNVISAPEIQIDARIQVVAGDFASGRSALKEIGLSQEDVDLLERAHRR